MSRPLRIYVAGPYTKGYVQGNVNRAMEAAVALIHQGHCPFCPHLSHYLDAVAREQGCPLNWDDWMAQDLMWLAQCDALLRLPGPSKGADTEVTEALRRGMLVYWRLEDVPPAQ